MSHKRHISSWLNKHLESFSFFPLSNAKQILFYVLATDIFPNASNSVTHVAVICFLLSLFYDEKIYSKCDETMDICTIANKVFAPSRMTVEDARDFDCGPNDD
jgi:hypothetical protein